MVVKRTVILGCGSALPETILTNQDLEHSVETSDAWIRQRTGIVQRHIAVSGETTSVLALRAARAALTHAGIGPEALDLILVATTTPDRTFPAVAVQVQEGLAMRHGAAFDLQAVCSGFLFGLATADAYLRAGVARHILLIGADTVSRLLDWTDRSTCVLFGDGAGAVVLGLEETDDSPKAGRGLLTCQIHSDGRYFEKLCTDGGVSGTQTVGHLTMQGREVFKAAVRLFSEVADSCFASVGLDFSALDWFIPHQANLRIIEASAERIGLPLEKVIRTVAEHGNTSAASIPLALDVAVRDQRVQRGNLLFFEAMGGGFTWGGALLRW